MGQYIIGNYREAVGDSDELLVFFQFFSCFIVKNTSLVGGIPSKSLYSACPSEEDAFIHCTAIPDAWCLVWIWLCTSAIPQDGISCSPHANFANQVRTKCFSLKISYRESTVYGM